MSTSSLNIALSHAISFLTRPLNSCYSPATINHLQDLLTTNLGALYAPSWVPKEPLRGSGRRCLALSPECLPPKSIYTACIAAGVQWFDWMNALGGKEFYLFVDPGCIAVRFGRKGDVNGQMITIWADEIPSPVVSRSTRVTGGEERRFKKTLAQELLEEDSEEDEVIFTMIAHEVAAPSWSTPIVATFGPRIFSHSRSSSRSSSSISSDSDFSSICSEKRPSRREKARSARIFVDTSKIAVTPYDGGKTTVLTGGVMLGGAPKAKKLFNNTNWRS